MTTPISNRYDFVLLFDVKDGNPNGDPDVNNMPRVDPETGHGLVTDVCIKRKIRNYVEIKHEDASPNKIYVREGTVLQTQRSEPYTGKAPGSKDKNDHEMARAFMCENFYDVRTFGAVMSTNKFNAGQVRGPVQLTFARSINLIMPMEHAITRVARETEARAAEGGHSEMGNKSTIAYGLYRAHGFVSPHLADGDKGTGFSEGDLSLLWEALINMFDFDRSAARGLMATQRLIVFKHQGKLGNARSQDLFKRLTVASKTDTPRSFDDFDFALDETELPAGISVSNLV